MDAQMGASFLCFPLFFTEIIPALKKNSFAVWELPILPIPEKIISSFVCVRPHSLQVFEPHKFLLNR